MRPRKAWVLQWHWIGNHAKVESNILHILRPDISRRNVKFYLKYLYLNSFLFHVDERLALLSAHDPPVMAIFDEGRSISIGSNPCLKATYVENMTSTYDLETRVETLEYDVPPKMRQNPKTFEIEETTERYRETVRIGR